MRRHLFIDIEFNDPTEKRIVSMCSELWRGPTILEERCNVVLQPSDGMTMCKTAESIHGLTLDTMRATGRPRRLALEEIAATINRADVVIAHGAHDDMLALEQEFAPLGIRIKPVLIHCTKIIGTPLCKLKRQCGTLKWPSLSELYENLFARKFRGWHTPLADVRACRMCYFAMMGMSTHENTHDSEDDEQSENCTPSAHHQHHPPPQPSQSRRPKHKTHADVFSQRRVPRTK